MTRNELSALLLNAKSIVISVLGKTLNIKSWENGKYSIEDKSKNSFSTYSSSNDLLEHYMIMNMSLESLTPWMNVTQVA